MNPTEKGLLLSSTVDFAIPSPFAQEHLYYLIQYGTYQCVPGYEVRREFLDMFLLAYIRSGILHVDYDGRTQEIHAGELFILDCHFPHRYYVTEPTEMQWFHFSGNESTAYVHFLTEEHGICFSGDADIISDFMQIFHYADKQLHNEHKISVYIQSIMSDLAIPNQKSGVPEVIQPAVDYILKNFQTDITLEQLSSLCHISVTHLIRCFTKYIGFQPHAYLNEQRLRHAKGLLVNTELSMEQIAEACGFNSATHFSRIFRTKEKMRPSDFRRLNL